MHLNKRTKICQYNLMLNDIKINYASYGFIPENSNVIVSLWTALSAGAGFVEFPWDGCHPAYNISMILPYRAHTAHPLVWKHTLVLSPTPWGKFRGMWKRQFTQWKTRLLTVFELVGTSYKYGIGVVKVESCACDRAHDDVVVLVAILELIHTKKAGLPLACT